MNPLVLVLGAAAVAYLVMRRGLPAATPVVTRPSPAAELNPANPANAAEVSRAYEGYPASTPVVFMDKDGQVRETTAGQLQQDFLALAQMQDTSFLPTAEDAPRDWNGTSKLPVPLMEYQRDYAPPRPINLEQFYNV